MHGEEDDKSYRQSRTSVSHFHTLTARNCVTYVSEGDVGGVKRGRLRARHEWEEEANTGVK